MDDNILDEGQLHIAPEDRREKARLTNDYDGLLEKQRFGMAAIGIALASRIIGFIMGFLNQDINAGTDSFYFKALMIDALIFGGAYIICLLFYKKRPLLSIGLGFGVFLIYSILQIIANGGFYFSLLGKLVILGFFITGLSAAVKIKNLKPQLLRFGIISNP